MNTQESLATPQADSAPVRQASAGRHLTWWSGPLLAVLFGALTGALAGVILLLALEVALDHRSILEALSNSWAWNLVGLGSLLGASFGAFVGLATGIHRVLFQGNSPHPIVWALLAGLGSGVVPGIGGATRGGFDGPPFLIIAAISALLAGLTALWLELFAPRPAPASKGTLRTMLFSLGAGFLLLTWQVAAMVPLVVYAYGYCCAQ